MQNAFYNACHIRNNKIVRNSHTKHTFAQCYKYVSNESLIRIIIRRKHYFASVINKAQIFFLVFANAYFVRRLIFCLLFVICCLLYSQVLLKV